MDLLDLKGVGPKKKEALNRLDIYSINDLYNYYPREYEDRSRKCFIEKAIEGKNYYFEFKIESSLYVRRTRRFPISYLYATDGKDRVKIVWFNDIYSPKKLKVGNSYKFYTKLEKADGVYVSYNPIFSELADDKTIGRIVAIYSLTKSLTSSMLSGFIKESLEFFDKKEEVLDSSELEKYKLNKREDNLREIHFPSSVSSLKNAKSQIKILDLLKELLFLEIIKTSNYQKQDLKLKYDLNKILDKIDFELTRSQMKSLNEVLEDVNKSKPMNRLLCGDVGSGKTIISIIIMIIFGINNYQSAMMVPTEVLAIQQFEKNKEFIESFGLKVGLLTSSVKDKIKIKEKLRNGELDLIIGTHALIQDDVDFSNLKLVINDEQHRFGVLQRQKLSLKGENPNYLTMTATPIPRTLYLKISELLDISVIDELPKSRLPITTKVVMESMEESLFTIIEEDVKKKRQVYVVTNNIEADDENSLENIYKRYKKKFKNLRISKLHGKLKSDEKEKILSKFSNGDIDILISTTVIEVGIDVKNANIMVIYNANKFGLSSLHQLRGRVGRGEFKSFCYLMTKEANGRGKLSILEKNTDGFKIAKLDLEMRGGGKILSSIQHGKNLEDVDYLSMAKVDIDRSFEIFKELKKHKFKGVDFDYIKKYFDLDKRIILN